MTRYASPDAFRRSLEDRLGQRSIELGVELDRLRRRVLFERILVRLEADAPGSWVLKGGMALEVRFLNKARTTRDLDVMTRLGIAKGTELRERLLTALGNDAEGDRFVFELSNPLDLRPDEAGRPGWRFAVTGRLAGRVFGIVKLDVVARPEEVGSTERLVLPNSLAFDGFPAHDFETVSPAQHFAEKLHALTRDYGRENTRTRDLVDLILLIENELVMPSSVMASVRLVFDQRRDHEVPSELSDPPSAWQAPYARLAAELDVGAKTLDGAMATLCAFWDSARREHEEV